LPLAAITSFTHRVVAGGRWLERAVGPRPRVADAHSPLAPAPERKRRYLELDGVRGLSIALVLIGHAARFSARAGDWALSLAALGVMIFFVLSGFLITDILSRELARTGRVSLSNFYLRRGLRLLPASLVFIAFVAVGIALGWITDVPWRSLAASVLYLRNVFGRGQTEGHLWSLSMEEQFYALWPLALLLLKTRRALPAALVAIALAFVGRGIAIRLALFDYNTGVFYVRPWFRFDSLLLGCVLALLWNDPARRESLQRWADRFRPAVAFPLLLGFSLAFDFSERCRPFFLTVQGLLAVAFLAGAGLGRRRAESALLTSAPIRALGVLSYSLYLWQQPFLVTRQPDWGLLRVMPFNVAAAFGAALASYYLVERPFLKLKDRFSTH
jgi:peptidoglycan/LPS O-acetylase OafA/YrhL